MDQSPQGILAGLFEALNARLDTSAPQTVEAEPLEIIETTHSFIYREHKVKYRLQDGTRGDRALRPDQLPSGKVTGMRLRVRQGYFDWSWVEGVDWISSSE